MFIDLDGRPAAIVAGGRAIIAAHVTAERRAYVEAKALYALKTQADELTGPVHRPRGRAVRRERGRSRGALDRSAVSATWSTAPALTPG